MVEPIPKRARLDNIIRERDEKVDVKRFECPLCMTTCDIMLNGISGNQSGHFEAIAKTASSGGGARSCASLLHEKALNKTILSPVFYSS